VAVLLGNGDGTFQAEASYSTGGFGAESIILADVNDDEKPDAIVANDSCDTTVCAGGAVGVLLNNTPFIRVRIDIEPGEFPNRIKPGGHEPLRVALLATATFDATMVDRRTVRFGPAGAAPIKARLRDVDGDGRLDAVFTFRTDETRIACSETSASLTGATTDGERFSGTDSITVRCHKSRDADDRGSRGHRE
jgi:uncharacterized protein YfcZ (UPF0381/DUF406 family)